MKRTILILIVVLCFALCSCGNTQENDEVMQKVQSAYLELVDADNYHVVFTTEHNGKTTSKYETWYADGDWMEDSSERNGRYLWVDDQCISGGDENNQTPEAQVFLKNMLVLEKNNPGIYGLVDMDIDDTGNLRVALTDEDLILKKGVLKEGAWLRVYVLGPDGRLQSVEKTATIADGSIIKEKLIVEEINNDSVANALSTYFNSIAD